MTVMKLLFIVSLIPLVNGCSQPTDWKRQTMQERLEKAKLIIYGKVHNKTEMDGGSIKQVYHHIDVYCIFKTDGSKQNIGKTLIINDEDPTPACVSNLDLMVKDRELIMMLQFYEDKFTFDNVNVQHAVFNATNDNIQSALCSSAVAEVQSPPQGTFECPEKENDKCNGGSTFHWVASLLASCVVLSLTANRLY